MIIKGDKRIKDEQERRSIEVKPRFGQYVIVVRIDNESVVVHEETNYQRAEGVFWFLLENWLFAKRLAEQYIRQGYIVH